jgi:putative endonuclease
MFWVYVLRSLSTGRLYTGSTSDLPRRLDEHQTGTSFSTRRERPWELAHREQFATRAEAVRRERYLKTGRGRDELRRTLAGHQRP